MSNREILKLVAGFRKFREKYFFTENSLYAKLSMGQNPKTLIIGCSDSRVDPAIISSASPGELFVVRNVANLVPPYETGGLYHGVSAAIEFAVQGLKVEHVIVLGHRQCGGIRALVNNQQGDEKSFVGSWMSIANKAKEKVLREHAGENEDKLCRHCEMEAITVSLENLMTFPFVKTAVDSGQMELHGIYFDLELGELYEYNKADGSFKNLIV
jgi:carbonic anhydrase